MGCVSSKTALSGQSTVGHTLLSSRAHGHAKSVDPATLHASQSKSARSVDTARTVESASGARYRRQITTSTNREDVDVLVTKFTCYSKMHSKDIAWKVQASRGLPQLEITVHVDKSILLNPEVNVTSDGTTLFPNSSVRAKSKMLEDFRYQWPFRGTISEGINEPHRFEVRPPLKTGAKRWYPATITKQRGDGLFEAVVEMPDNKGMMRTVNFPAVSKNDVREIGSEETLHISEQCLMLHVPKSDPLLAALNVNGQEVTTQFLGRSTPPVNQPEGLPSFRMSDDGKGISANVGHGVLVHFLSGAVRSVTSDLQRHHRSWTIQIGPFAEHIIKITRHPWPSRVVTLTVDDDVLVEACAEDIGCATTSWECKFRFVGEKVMNFDVYESNLDGVNLGTRGQVTKREKYSHKCSVLLKDDMDVSKAEFVIDDICFQDLPPKATSYEETNLSMELNSFLGTYGPIIPRKVNRTAAICFMDGLVAFAREGGDTDSATAAAGLTVMRSVAKGAAVSGVAAAVSAARSGVDVVSTAAAGYSPIVAEAAGKTAKSASNNLRGMFAWCCIADHAEGNAEEVGEDDTHVTSAPMNLHI